LIPPLERHLFHTVFTEHSIITFAWLDPVHLTNPKWLADLTSISLD
jgi:hypothetical protein